MFLGQAFDIHGCLLTEELQNDLMYYQHLVEVNKNNKGITAEEVLGLKELLRYRTRLIIQKVLPIEEMFKNIPFNVKNKLSEVRFIDYFFVLMKNCSNRKQCYMNSILEKFLTKNNCC